MTKEPISPEFRRHLETTYSPIPKDEGEKIADSLIDLMVLGSNRRQSLKAFFEQVVRFAFRQFGFSEVAIGLKERNEDIWRYEVAFGFTKDVEAKIFRTRYDRDDMYSQERFPNIKTGKLSELNVAEGLPLIETDKYDRPYRWNAKRTSHEDFLAGDFLDFWMMDRRRRSSDGSRSPAPRITSSLPG